MGTFDGWSQGEHLSPEYTGSYTKFSTMLMLRPGRYRSNVACQASSSAFYSLTSNFFILLRYEIKFLVDGEWHLSPEFLTVGDGPMENNLLIVE